MTAIKLHLDRIRVDGGTQTRAGLSDDTVGDYAEAMQAGAVFPPVVVFFDGTDYWLADGFHRVAAARLAGAKKVDAGVCQGTQRDARLYSVGANKDHGQRRTNADKRRAVETLLRDEEWARWSDREIARRAAVSYELVRQLRAICQPLTDGEPAPRLATRGGTTYEMAPREPWTPPPDLPLRGVIPDGSWTPDTEGARAQPDPSPAVLEPSPAYDGDEWYTPAKYVEAAREVMGFIDLDPASCEYANQTVKATTYFSKEVDGRFGKWLGKVWLNPPYSDPEPFTSKLLEEFWAGRVKEAVLLVNNQTDAAWFQRLLRAKHPACFVAGRMRFERPDRESGPARQGQAIFYLGENLLGFFRVFGAFGTMVMELQGLDIPELRAEIGRIEEEVDAEVAAEKAAREAEKAAAPKRKARR